jgi:hypothetical protein
MKSTDRTASIGTVVSLAATMLAAAAASFSAIDFYRDGRRWVLAVGVVLAACAALIAIYFSRKRERLESMRRVFLIYSEKDRDQARTITSALRRLGYNPWFDAEEIVPGQHWEDAVLDGLRKSSVALFLVSRNANARTRPMFLDWELAMAKKTMRSRHPSSSPIIPIRLDDSPVPEELQGVQSLDLDREDAMDRLAMGLDRILGPRTSGKGADSSPP